MLARRHRLPTSFFQQLKGKRGFGQKLSKGALVARIFPSPFPYSRFGVVVSRSAGAQSVGRNRLRRVVYEWVRTNNLFQKPHMDVVIIPRSTLLTEPASAIFKELKELFRLM